MLYICKFEKKYDLSISPGIFEIDDLMNKATQVESNKIVLMVNAKSNLLINLSYISHFW